MRFKLRSCKCVGTVTYGNLPGHTRHAFYNVPQMCTAFTASCHMTFYFKSLQIELRPLSPLFLFPDWLSFGILQIYQYSKLLTELYLVHWNSNGWLTHEIFVTQTSILDVPFEIVNTQVMHYLTHIFKVNVLSILTKRAPIIGDHNYVC